MRLSAAFLLSGIVTWPATDAPLVPLCVCEVVHDLAAYEGKDVAIIGRYSFRETGRSINEQSCDPALEAPAQLQLVEDTYRGPKPPGNFELDGIAVNRKLAQIRHRTTLGKFRFGTPDYDRWAVVYGEVKARHGDDAKKAPANFVFRGDGVVIFLTPQQ